jgi:hypothetical protein
MSLQPQPIKTLIEKVLQEVFKLKQRKFLLNYTQFYSRLTRLAQEEVGVFCLENLVSH